MSVEESRGRITGREEHTVLRIHIANWSYLEAEVKNHRPQKQWNVITGAASGCSIFLKRHGQ